MLVNVQWILIYLFKYLIFMIEIHIIHIKLYDVIIHKYLWIQ